MSRSAKFAALAWFLIGIGATVFALAQTQNAPQQNFSPGSLSTPGPIGGTTPAAGTFTTLTATIFALVNALNSTTPPTISSGFGTSPAILSSNGNATFRVNVGTGGTATAGVIGLPGTNGWNCGVYNLTAHLGNRADDTVVTAASTNTVSVQNQTKSTGAAVAWTASDTLVLSCGAF